MKTRGSVVSAVSIVFITLLAGLQLSAQQASYPTMAPLNQYLMDRNAEIALARSAAPELISRDADVLVLGRQGFETAVKGKNGFVCIVQRGWSAGVDDPDFWNPKLRGPICFNAAGARFNIPITMMRTKLILAGQTKTQMFEQMKAAFERKELAAPEPGAMCYMLSKNGYLSDRGGHWHPHFMFFLPLTEPAAWGAGPAGSPVLGFQDVPEQHTVFMIPVHFWSDGSPDSNPEH